MVDVHMDDAGELRLLAALIAVFDLEFSGDPEPITAGKPKLTLVT